MEEKVLLKVKLPFEYQVDELVQDPKVYGEAIKHLINTMRSSSDKSDIIWEDEDVRIVFTFSIED